MPWFLQIVDTPLNIVYQSLAVNSYFKLSTDKLIEPELHIVYMLITGSMDPPGSHHIENLYVSLAEIIIISLLTGLGLLLTMVFLLFNIIWRKNR